LSATLDDLGVIARSAPDCRAMLDGLAPEALPSAIPWRSGRGWRIGVIRGPADMDSSVARALSRAIDAARDACADVELVDPAWDWAALRRLSLTVTEIEAQAEHGARRALSPSGFSPALHKMLDWAQRLPAPRVCAAYDGLARGAASIRASLAGFDAVLSPTTATPAFCFDDPAPAGQADYTLLANVSGFCATAFPVGLQDDGLPVSLQVMSPSDAFALHWAGRLARPIAPPAGF
jgi:aspartyl-tRNA(Asn)/glutamyl-tRNA(Gln) amidotransferase subunit A